MSNAKRRPSTTVFEPRPDRDAWLDAQQVGRAGQLALHFDNLWPDLAQQSLRLDGVGHPVDLAALRNLPVLLVMMAIERIGPALSAQTGMVGPMSTILMGVLILGEPFTG